MPSSIAALLGLLLLFGVWTPILGLFIALLELCIASSRTGQAWPALLGAAVAAALSLVGPGAYSIDARRYGRKRVVFDDHKR